MKLAVKILHVNLLVIEKRIDVKAVVNHYENSNEIIIPRNCHMIHVDRSSNERSITVYRLTARKICKQSEINGHLHSRNREPSRIPVKKVIQIMGLVEQQFLHHLNYFIH